MTSTNLPATPGTLTVDSFLPPSRPLEKRYERVWWWILVGSRGGPTRCRILLALMERPMNKRQLSLHLGLNYKTVEKHVKILEDNGLIEQPSPGAYGSPYFLTRVAMDNRDLLLRLIRESLGDEAPW